MATVTGLTKERMETIEANSIVDGDVVSGHLILTKHDGSTIDAGSVVGPTGAPGVDLTTFNAQVAAINAAIATAVPAGVVDDYVGTTAPTGFILLTGQLVTNFQGLYPAAWAVIPASWKSGSNATMPDTRKRVAVGYDVSDVDFDTIGEVGGAKTVTLATGEIPGHTHTGDVHTHTINPPNTAVSMNDPSHNHSQNAHNHSQNAHAHTDGGHLHGAQGFAGSKFIVVSPGSSFGFAASAGPYSEDVYRESGTLTAYANIQATTATNIAATATNNGAYTGISGAVDISPFSSGNQDTVTNTGSTGGGGAHNNLQPYVVLTKMMRVY
jgi:microcystin-dependent protein